MSAPTPSRWADLFDIAISIIDQSNREAHVVDGWTFGGGTALMLQIEHRESHDIDLIIKDPQILPFLNPETQSFDLAIEPSSYETDGASSLKIVFDGVGEIDVVCCSSLLPIPSMSVNVRGRLVDLETPAEIIAKKVFHRGARLQPRDMFDLAAVARTLGEKYVRNALAGFPEKAAAALTVAQRLDPGLVREVLGALNVMPKFADLQESAQAEAIAVLGTGAGC